MEIVAFTEVRITYNLSLRKFADCASQSGTNPDMVTYRAVPFGGDMVTCMFLNRKAHS